MNHDHDVGAARQGDRVAALRVGAVAAIAGVDQNVDAKLCCDLGGLVAACIVDQDDIVHDLHRNFREGSFDRLAGVVRRHHHCNLEPVDHSLSSPTWLRGSRFGCVNTF